MEPNSTINNSDAAPEASSVDQLASRLLSDAVRAYWTIARVGVVFCQIASLMATVMRMSKPFDPGDLAPVLWLLFFVYIACTAHSLEKNFERVYRRARWSAVIASGVFFPWLTLPGAVAVRRLEEYHKFLVAQQQAEP